MKSINRCKCVLIGDAAVGKTSIVKSLIGRPEDAFHSNYTMTTGVEIFRKSIRQPNSEQVLEFFIYDFSGRSMYADLVRQIWSNNVTVIVGVFDVSRQESLSCLQSSLTELLQQISRPQDVVGIIVGNKNDLSHRRVVRSEDAMSLAKRFKMRYFDLSAKEDAPQIEQAFFHLTQQWLERHTSSRSMSADRNSVSSSNNNNKSRRQSHRQSSNPASNPNHGSNNAILSSS